MKRPAFLRDGATAVVTVSFLIGVLLTTGTTSLLYRLWPRASVSNSVFGFQTRVEPIGDAPIGLIPWLLVGIAMLVSSWGLFYKKLWAVWAIRMACIAFALLYLPGFFLPSGIESTSYMWVQVFFGVALAMLAVACIGYLFSRRFTDRLFSDHRQEVGL